MVMDTYHKIQTLFKRDMTGEITGKKGKMLKGEWSTPELGYLADNPWEFTEKVDGTNIRIEFFYDDVMDTGWFTKFGGRTDRAVIPKPLMAYLEETFTVRRFREAGFDHDVILYGEGYGPSIQGGGKYRDDVSFVLFDVKIGGFWLDRANVDDIAAKLGIESVPIIGVGTLHKAISWVSETPSYSGLKSTWGDFEAEGIVARPIVPLFNRKGERVICKIKGVDFK